MALQRHIPIRPAYYTSRQWHYLRFLINFSLMTTNTTKTTNNLTILKNSDGIPREIGQSTSTSWLEIDLRRIDDNLTTFARFIRRDQSSNVKICAVVKADAYHLGSIPIAKRMENWGVDMLAVFSLSQAELLIQAQIITPLIVLMPIYDLGNNSSLHSAAAKGQLHLTIQNDEQINTINAIGTDLNCAIPVHLYLDTGMSRGGVTRKQFDTAIAAIASAKHLKLVGICTHMTSAESDPQTVDEQYTKLDAAITENTQHISDDVIVHGAATYASLRATTFHRNMVRLGLGIHGYGENDMVGHWLGENNHALKPILRWVSSVVHISQHAKGETVGYNRTCQLKRASTLGLVPAGHGDGYAVRLSNKATVNVIGTDHSGKPIHATAPVMGLVSMDQTVIDLTDIPWATRGCEVELISNDISSLCSLPNLAKIAGTNCYEMLSRLSMSLPRVYIE